jgi:hypothetical protein
MIALLVFHELICINFDCHPVESAIYIKTRVLHWCVLPMIIIRLIDEKNELILWNLSSIRMKIFNDIRCSLNWIGLKFMNWIQIHWLVFELNLRINSTKFNSTIGFQFNCNLKEMGCKLLKKVLKIYLWIWCWKNKKNFRIT